MADRKPEGAGFYWMADTAPGTTGVVDPASHFLALLAVLTQTIAKVRLFEDVDGSRTQRFDAAVPATRDLLPLVRKLFVAAGPAAEETRPARSGQRLGGDLAKGGLKLDPDLLIRVARILGRPGESTDAPPVEQSAGYEPASEPDPLDKAILIWWFEQPTRRRETTLDVIFHHASKDWRVELSPRPGLRGESLADLRRTAPPLPDPSEMRSYDVPHDAYFTAPAAARFLGVDRSTVTRRVGADQLVGFTVFKRSLRIPKDQFLGPDVIPGVPEVLALFRKPTNTLKGPADHKSAWAFLGSDLYHGDPEPRPIDRLRAAAVRGTTELVMADLASAKESLDRGDHV